MRPRTVRDPLHDRGVELYDRVGGLLSADRLPQVEVLDEAVQIVHVHAEQPGGLGVAPAGLVERPQDELLLLFLDSLVEMERRSELGRLRLDDGLGQVLGLYEVGRPSKD